MKNNSIFKEEEKFIKIIRSNNKITEGKIFVELNIVKQ